MKKIFIGFLMLSAFSLIFSASRAEEWGMQDMDITDQVIGNWEGLLSVMGTEHLVRLSLDDGEDGILSGFLALPRQVGVPFDASVEVDTPKQEIIISVSALQVRFEASYVEETGLLSGSWMQGGMSFPLELARSEFTDILAVPRPQDPIRPFPYHERNVVFINVEESINLAGTLTYPKIGGPFPAVILVTGSGAHTRDMEIFGHRPFKVLADYLTRNGIAVLRYDDRGAGSSEGNPNLGTSLNFSRDTEAALDYLLSLDEVDSSRIGILGISEGGMIGPLVADRRSEVSFLVLMAAPGIRGDEVLMTQSRAIMEAQQFPQQMIDVTLQLNRTAYDLMFSDLEGEELKRKFEELFSGFGMQPQDVQAQVSAMMLPWMRWFIRHDPSEVLKKLTVPILALQGDKDTQVIAEVNTPAIEKALIEAGNTRFTVKVYQGLNHIFQPAVTGHPGEYGSIDITMDEQVMKDISSWILKLSK